MKSVDMKIEIGKILKAQGIKGEVKMKCYLDDAAMLKGIKQLYIGANVYTVEQVRPDGAFCYLKFVGINDRNTAETLRDWTVFAEKRDFALPSNRYFIQDLLDCIVTTDSGKTVGKIVDVLQYGAADVFVCLNNGKTVSFPFVDGLAQRVNVERKSIIVDAKRFEEVAVYED